MIRWTTQPFHRWRAKLGSLALAIILWLVIRNGIRYSSPASPTSSVAAPEAAPRE